MATTTMDLAKERSALIYKIIEQIRRFPAIWDISCREYKDSYMRNEAYKGVANAMDMTVPQVKERYRNLRTYYGREKKKIERSERNGDGPSDGYRSKWEYFDALDVFLKDSLRGRQPSSWLSTEWSPRAEEEAESLGDGGSLSEENADPPFFGRKRLKLEQDGDESWDATFDVLREPLSPPVRQQMHVSPQPIALHSNSSFVGQIVPRRAEPAQESQSRSTSMEHSGIYTGRAQRQVEPVPAQTVSQSEPPAPVTTQAQQSLPSLDSLFGQIVGRQLEYVPEGKKKELLKLKVQRLIFEAQFDIDPCSLD